MAHRHTRQLVDGLVFLPLAIGRINHSGVEHLSGPVYHRHFTAIAVTRVQAHGDLSLHRRLHQKRLQVQSKLADGPLAGAVGQLIPNLPL
ncbi:hypothetical protein SDC9_161293 [bioreactor metagenome]|uniref:Uncharacterized protein n=1 Tax=bioreactor metagenome TaxID=1076179 RepID=A0A645FHY5_9ZZZZ